MRIKVISDVHVEFHGDYGWNFTHLLNSTDVDVLVIAGDLGSWETVEAVLKELCLKFSHVVFVNGNHEWYRFTNKNPLPDYSGLRKHLMKLHSNLHWLERDIWVHQGVRFVGCTLWFPDNPLTFSLRYNWSDFVYIPKLSDWMFKENRKSVAFFERNLKAGDVAVSHYLPTYASVSERYRGDKHTEFYVTDLSNLIVEREPAVWIHGHTHDSKDFELHRTRVVCNPFGYDRPGRRNLDFEWNKIIEVPVLPSSGPESTPIEPSSNK